MQFFSIFIAITLNTVAMTHFAAAQELMPTVTTQTELPTCNADAKRALRSMCSFVSGRDSIPEAQDRYRFLYQKKMYEAACVDLKKDSEEIIAKKISKTWKDNEQSLTCTNVQFDVSKGNLIKFAVSNNFDEFILDAIRWKVNLNKVDDSDGRTVLDYVRDMIAKSKNTSMRETLERYYANLRKAGAKHANEL